MLLRFDGSLMFEALHFKRRLVISTTGLKVNRRISVVGV